MKIVLPLKWLLLRARIFKAPHASSLNYCTKTFQTTFTNPDRGQSKNSELSFTKSDLPLQVHSSLNRQNNHGRIYSGNNPSVTTILDATRPKNELYALHNWRRGLIKELGEGGYNDEVNKIKNRGTTFHQSIKEYFLSGSQPTLHESNLGHWESVQHVLSNIDRIIALESVVIHPQLQYAGTLDSIILYEGELYVVDWKTSQKKRADVKDCFSYPHQIVAYTGAVNYDPKYHPMQINHGLLVMAYQDGSPADTIWMPTDMCEHYWTEWLHRLQLYNQIAHTSCYPNQGTRMQHLAQYINGVPNGKSSQVQRPMKDDKSSEIDIDIAEWSETIVDFLETDPSTNEFDEKYRF